MVKRFLGVINLAKKVRDRGAPPISWLRYEAYDAENKDLPIVVEDALQAPVRILTEPLRCALYFVGRKTNMRATKQLFAALANPHDFPADEPGRILYGILARERDAIAKSHPNEIF